MTRIEKVVVPDGVDNAKANRLIKWLLEIENENNRTGKLSNPAMVQKIGKRIQDDVRCL